MQIALHGFPDVVRKAHTDECVRNLFVPMGLAQFEEAAGNGRRVLEGSE